MATIIGLGQRYTAQTSAEEVAAVVPPSKRGAQVVLTGTDFSTATISLAGMGTIQGSGANGSITDADINAFTEYDSMDLSAVAGHTAIIDKDLQVSVVKVGALQPGDTVTIF